MKKAHLFILLILTSCTYFQTKQQRAERLAKKYLDSALQGVEKYELIKTSEIDTLRSGPDNEQEYQLITRKVDRTYKTGDSLNMAMANPKNKASIATLQDLGQKNYDNRNVLLKESLKYLLNYKGKPDGWIIEETYRLKNDSDSSLHIATFKIDNKLSRVLSQQTTKK